MFDLEQAINERRSTRMFLPDKTVPRDLVDEALELAIRAPSNSNIQPRHLVLATGATRDRLVEALLHEASSKPPKVPLLAHGRPWPGSSVCTGICIMSAAWASVCFCRLSSCR